MELTLTRKPATDPGPFSPGQPRVNLVPPAAIDRAANTRARRQAIAAWAASVLAVAAVWGAGMYSQNAIKADLAEARSDSERLAVELAQYAPVTSIAQQTQALNDTVAAQTSGEIDHADVISRFLAAAGDTMTVENLQITTDGPGACVSTDPFQQVPLAGCITFTGTASGGGGTAAQILTALRGDTWFADPFIPSVGSTPNDSGQVSFTGTAGLTMEAYAAPPVDPTTDPAQAGTEN